MYIAAAITAAVVFVCSMPWFRSKVQLAGEHVIITGGSEGLGFCLAKEFCEKKCRVTIIARTKSKLDQALNNLQEMALPEVQVQALTADVTQNEQAGCLHSILLQHGPSLHVLICKKACRCKKLFSKHRQFLGLVTLWSATQGLLSQVRDRMESHIVITVKPTNFDSMHTQGE